MTRGQLVRRNLLWYWRTNLAVIAGGAVGVAVLAGALLVGDSVRASLRTLVVERLGAASYVISSDTFFREALAADLAAHPGFRASQPPLLGSAPMVAVEGAVLHEKSRRRSSGVAVYGVDARFWKFHGVAGEAIGPGEVLLSPGLAAELGAAPGDSLLLRVSRHSDIPVESLHSRKEDLSRAVRLSVRETLPAESLGEFSLRPQQGAVRAVFVALERLQRDLDLRGQVNGILISEPEAHRDSAADSEAARRRLETLLHDSVTLDDLGARIVAHPSGGWKTQSSVPVLSVESDRLLLDDRLADAARAAASKSGWKATSVFTYLANTIRIGEREIPYSLVAAMDAPQFAVPERDAQSAVPLWLNDWAWRELGARQGDRAALEYYVWHEGGRLETRTAELIVRGRVPMDGLGGDRTLAPAYPGISDSLALADWDPPFPLDLKRIHPRDEDYWRQYRTAPKAFVPLAAGQRLWESRFGKLTAVRLEASGATSADDAVEALRSKLRENLDPVAAGVTVTAVRAAGAAASHGAVNFSLYFVSFSFFIVVSAMLLVGLFFRLGIEQRLKEIGLLEAFGYTSDDIRRLFLSEAILLVIVGSALGAAGAAGYGALMVHGLKTWWVDAIGTTHLRLALAPASLAMGIGAGAGAAAAGIWWTLGALRTYSPRSLVTGAPPAPAGTQRKWRRALRWAAAAAALAFALLAAAWFGALDAAGAFFGAGGLLLAAFVGLGAGWLGARMHRSKPAGSILRMGFRNAAWRPGRSLLCIVLVASATFILAGVEAFRRAPGTETESRDPHSGTGGFPLLAESLVPVPFDANSREGREKLNFSEAENAALVGVKFFSFRLRPGDDASCLNLYRPQNPRVLGVPQALIETGRFRFAGTAAGTQAAKPAAAVANPWLLLNANFSDGALPAIVDANTMTYVLGRKLGDEIVIEHQGRAVRLRLVATLADSLFQSELLISEENFLRAFPNEPGFRFFLLDTPVGKSGDVAAALEEALASYAFDVRPAGERLAAYHRVENTYVSTFQSLGGLGLLLGTLGLAAVMLRNLAERRRELAVLRAAGFDRRAVGTLVLAENSVLLVGGISTGIVSAGVAVLPALMTRGGFSGGRSLGALLAGVVLTGLLAALVAVAAALRAPLVNSLRSE